MSAIAAALWRRVLVLALVAGAVWSGNPAASPMMGRPALVPNDPYYTAGGLRWIFEKSGFEDAWSRTLGDSSVVVAVVDTGVDETPDLRGALLRGYDAYDGTGDTADVTGHGTAVASLIAARTNDARGMAGACGRCSILPVRVTAPDGSAPVSAIAAGIVWAADHGARVINVSLVVTTGSPVLAAAVTHAHDRGALVVAAAGNESRRGPDYPAGIAGVVSVEASTRSGAAYDFSNYGREIAVAAPGCAVVAERAGGHTSQCGTSVAAPLVAGAAALVASVTPNATADTLANAIELSADRRGDTRYGFLNVARALTFAH